jgi:hypothetical protein
MQAILPGNRLLVKNFTVEINLVSACPVFYGYPVFKNKRHGKP